MSPEQNIKNVLVKLQQDYANGDVDEIMTAYSEDYTGSQGQGKAQVEKSAHATKTGFSSVYWSAGWWGNKYSSLGILCEPNHPALSP